MLVLPERERTKKGAIGVETKGVTCKIPLDLHNQISEENQGNGKYDEQIHRNDHPGAL